MKTKWKHSNELLAVIVLTGVMLLVPMNNYAVNGVNSESYDTVNTVLGDEPVADDGSTAIGDGAVADTDSVAVGTDAEAYENSTAVGVEASADTESTAIGACTEVVNTSTAVGANAVAENDSAAVGSYAGAGEYSAAVGTDSEATEESTAVGERASAECKSTAIGMGADACGSSTAVGMDVMACEDSTAIGYETDASHKSIAVGFRSSADEESTAVGKDSSAQDKSTVVGYGVSAEEGSIVVGKEADATGNSIAIGINAEVTNNSIAIGHTASADYNSVAIGNDSTVVYDPDSLNQSDLLSGYISAEGFAWDAVDDDMNTGIVSLGHYGEDGSEISRRLTHVKNGRVSLGSTDAVNGGQLYAVWKNLDNKINHVDPGTDGITDFRLVNGQDTIIDKNGNAISVAGETTGYKADENGNIHLKVMDPEDNETIHDVILTDVASAQKLNEVDERVTQNTQNIEGLKQSVNQLDSRIDRVGAGAAALAALRPLDFDPDAKWDFTAGYGNYRGANAIALGTYYRPDETKMFSIGGSFGGGENMVNAGVTVKLGHGSGYGLTSRVMMAKTLKTMKQEMNKDRIDIAKEHTDMITEIEDVEKMIKTMQKELDAMKTKNG